MKTIAIELPETHTISLKANSEHYSIESAFDKLHRRIKNNKTRKFFGVLNPQTDPMNYRACVVTKDESEIVNIGFEKYTIPGGSYVTTSLKNWETNIKQIPYIFEMLSEKNIVDNNRPYLEFYKNTKELVLFLPIKPRVQQLSLF